MFPRRTRSFYSAAFVFVAALLSASCAENAEEAAREAVRRYNEVLVDAYLRPDPELMARYAAPRELGRIREYIFFLLKEKNLLRCEMHEIVFLETAVSGAAAVVRVKEKWTCQKISSETRRSDEEPEPFLQEVRYELDRAEDRWVVSAVEVIQPLAAPPLPAP